MSSVPRLEPSSFHWTPATDILSVDVATREIVPETVELFRDEVMETTGAWVSLNVAPTVVLAETVTEQELVPLHPPPLQRVNVEPDEGVAVKVIWVPPDMPDSEQSLPQLIPVPVTVPSPVPDLVVVRVKVVGGGGVEPPLGFGIPDAVRGYGYVKGV